MCGEHYADLAVLEMRLCYCGVPVVAKEQFTKINPSYLLFLLVYMD